MSESKHSLSRRDSILQALASMLENQVGERITTAALAREVGVSEAALYRQFPSKAKMFEALIEYVEDTLFSRVNLILAEDKAWHKRCGKVLSLFLTFCDKNPGLCRLLTADILTGEKQRLRKRTNQIFERLETQLKQVLRTAEVEEGARYSESTSAIAGLLVAVVQGKLQQYVQSGFKNSPEKNWDEQWSTLNRALRAARVE